MSTVLKGGFQTEDQRLDRLPQFDERSRDYPVRTAIPVQRPRSFTWPCNVFLDQGQEGACTGFSTAHELGAMPKACPVTNETAEQIYHRARQLDEWPGEDYEGSSVLGAVKAATEMGYYREYRWAFGLDDLILAVGRKGPAILGINWYEKMFEPDKFGFVEVGGKLSGGHAILCRGVNVGHRYFVLHNSWGQSWGHNATAFISFEDMDRLLHEDGEACIPITREKV